MSDAPPIPDAVPELVDAFRFEAARLGEDFARASTLGRGTAQEIADHRENVFRELVTRFFPAPHNVTKVKRWVRTARGRPQSTASC